MDLFIALCGFAGGWLLVAGPVYQAALELQEEEFERRDFDVIRKQLPPQPHASAWWWLLPPIKLILEKRVNTQYQKDFMAAIPPEKVESILHYMNKASGWVLVSGGGLLLALGETYDLVHHLDWPVIYFWLISVAMAALCVTNTAFRMSRTRSIQTKNKTPA